jgi:hypothetical protein
VTGVADKLTSSQAVIHGTVTPSGLPTTWTVQFGTAPGVYSAATPTITAGSGLIPAEVTGLLGGLTPATTYYYRVSAQNTSGVAVGAERNFTTAAAPPTVNPPTTTPPQRPISARVRHRAIPVAGRGIRVARLRVISIRNARVTVRCTPACGARRLTISRGTTANFDAVFRRRVLRPGSTIEIRVTRRGEIGRTFTFKATRTGLSGRACILRGTPVKPRSCVPYRPT